MTLFTSDFLPLTCSPPRREIRLAHFTPPALQFQPFMTSGLVASVVCPACGQPFLCQQQAAEGMVTCPHCAHQGYRAHFATQGQTASLAPGRRQAFQRPAEMPVSMQPVFEPTPAPMQAPMTAPVMSPQPAPQIWRQQAYTQPTAAMQPSLHLPPPAEGDEMEFVPPHQQGSPVKTFLLGAAMVAVLGIGGWVWWDAQNDGAKRPKSEATPILTAPEIPPAPEPEVRRAAIPTTAETAEAVLPAVDVAAMQSEARGLVSLTKVATHGPLLRRAAFVVAGVAWSVLFGLPALLHRPPLEVMTLAAGTGAVGAVIAIGLSALTGSAFAARLVLLTVWYAYLSS